jgi:hypothetical protein
VLVALLLLASALAASAQVGASTGLPGNGKFFVGGGVGLSFGDVDYVEIAPIVGYRPVPQFDFGIGLTYRWSNYSWYGRDLSTNDYGFTLFADYYVWRGLFARGEYEYLDYEYPVDTGGTDRTGYNAFKLGGGYMLPIGGAAGLYFTALYNFTYDAEDSPYGDPWGVGVGVSLGF